MSLIAGPAGLHSLSIHGFSLDTPCIFNAGYVIEPTLFFNKSVGRHPTTKVILVNTCYQYSIVKDTTEVQNGKKVRLRNPIKFQ